jgi:hypothetical protein
MTIDYRDKLPLPGQLPLSKKVDSQKGKKKNFAHLTGFPSILPPLNHDEQGPVQAVRLRNMLAWRRKCSVGNDLGRTDRIFSTCILVITSIS